MDTLTSKSITQTSNWKEHQLEEYEGSWNHFISSLVDGNQKQEGFIPYTLKGTFEEKKPSFKNVIGKQLQLIHPDSIIAAKNGKIYLRNISGLEIHYQTTKGRNKFYRKYSNKVIRLSSDSSRVVVTRNGIFSPEDLTLTGSNANFLKTVPVDYQKAFVSSNAEPLVFLKNSNLKIVKELREKTYVQTDKPYYYPTDTLWFKAYMKYASPQFADTLSKVLYVNLVDSTTRVIESRILKIEKGVAWGEFILPIDLPIGNYYMVAYTNWMRNFNEVFIRPIPIIKLSTFIEPQNRDSTLVSLSHINPIVTLDKKYYKTRSPVDIDITILKDHLPQLANFSVSVVDQTAITQLRDLPTIFSLKDKFNSEGTSMIRIKHLLERGITLSGKIISYSSNLNNLSNVNTPSKKGIYQVVALLMNKNEQEVIETTRNNFSFSFDFTDTTTAVLKAVKKDGELMGIELRSVEPYFFSIPTPLKFNISKNSNPRYIPNISSNVKMLEEITIKASRITPLTTTTVTTRRYGLMAKLIEGSALAEVRKANNLLILLNRMVPGFYATNKEILNPSGYQPSAIVTAFENASQSSGKPKDTQLSSSTPSGVQNKSGGLQGSQGDQTPSDSGSQKNNPSQFTTGGGASPGSRPPYKIFLDGAIINYQDFSMIPYATISRIEIFDKFSGGDDNIIAIYTETSIPMNTQNYKFKLHGYNLPIQFRAPSLPSKAPDYRTTIYWNPNISTNESGYANLSFNTSNAEGKYSITIEGISNEGDVFRSVKEITVNK